MQTTQLTAPNKTQFHDNIKVELQGSVPKGQVLISQKTQTRISSFLIFVVLSFTASSFLIASPVDDFLNPEKKRKTSASSPKKETPAKTNAAPSLNEDATPETVSKKNPKEKTESAEAGANDSDADDKSSGKNSKNSKVKEKKEEKSKEQNLSTSKKKKYEDALPTVKDDTPSTPSYSTQGVESVSGGGVPVLCYHHLAAEGGPMGGYNLHPNLLEEQFKFLKAAGYKTVRLDQFYAYINGRNVDFRAKSGMRTV